MWFFHEHWILQRKWFRSSNQTLQRVKFRAGKPESSSESVKIHLSPLPLSLKFFPMVELNLVLGKLIPIWNLVHHICLGCYKNMVGIWHLWKCRSWTLEIKWWSKLTKGLEWRSIGHGNWWKLEPTLWPVFKTLTQPVILQGLSWKVQGTNQWTKVIKAS